MGGSLGGVGRGGYLKSVVLNKEINIKSRTEILLRGIKRFSESIVIGHQTKHHFTIV